VKKQVLRSVLMFTAIVLAASITARAYAQAPGPGHPPGGQMPGQMPGHPPGMGGPPPTGNPGGSYGSSNTGGGTMGATAGRSTSVTSSGGVKLGPTGRWWDEKTFVRTIGISRDQQRKMDAIFDANKPAIIETYKTLETQKAKYTALSSNTQVDKSELFASIDAVNQARAALQKANTQMLLQIRDQLSKDQVVKLESLP
jgi:Spy/CpxP family protein refolding chaperone